MVSEERARWMKRVNQARTVMDSEVLYSFKVRGQVTGNPIMEVAKWGPYQRPLEVYKITNSGKGTCDCIGSGRNPFCKHRRMIDHLLGAYPKTSFIGCFYDAYRDLLYHPDDGEGISLKGAVDIRALSN